MEGSGGEKELSGPGKYDSIDSCHSITLVFFFDFFLSVAFPTWKYILPVRCRMAWQ